MSRKVAPRAEVEIRLCKSKDTKKLYYGLFENDVPVKYWDFEMVSDAGRDMINELIKAFDLGYDIRCQFPINDGDIKKVIPRIVKMYNEPCNSNKKTKVDENFFEEEKTESPID